MNAIRLASCLSRRAPSRLLARGVAFPGRLAPFQSVAPISTSDAVVQANAAVLQANAAALQATAPALHAPALHELGSVDHGFTDDRIDRAAEPERRAFTYLLLSGVRFAYASTARVLVVKFVSSMSASADVLALASAEFDVSGVSPGKTITVKWRGKPVFIRHRTPAEVDAEAGVPLAALRDEESDEERTLQPEWLVVLGICTHLGCVPISGAGDYGGWFCPCHGSHYDVSGRIRKGPAPLNLEVPPYKFTGDAKILIG